MTRFSILGRAALAAGLAVALAGCSGLNLGWGAVQQAAPGTATISVTPNCQGQSQAGDLPCISATGAQNMDSVHFAVGRDAQGNATLDVAATGIDPARNQAIAAQALQATAQQLGAITQVLAPIIAPLAATAIGGPAAGAVAGAVTRPKAVAPASTPQVLVDPSVLPPASP